MANSCTSARFRVWITRYRGPYPCDCDHGPPEAVFLEPAEHFTMTARQARRYVDAFNRAALSRRRRFWAVAWPVQHCVSGEPVPGSVVRPQV
jgi:hypothetical protein